MVLERVLLLRLFFSICTLSQEVKGTERNQRKRPGFPPTWQNLALRSPSWLGRVESSLYAMQPRISPGEQGEQRTASLFSSSCLLHVFYHCEVQKPKLVSQGGKKKHPGDKATHNSFWEVNAESHRDMNNLLPMHSSNRVKCLNLQGPAGTRSGSHGDARGQRN